MIFATNGLIYLRGGLQGHYSAEYAQRYAPGTPPANWETAPDIDDLKAQLLSQPKQLAADADAGMFDVDAYPSWSLGGVLQIDNFYDIALYNLQHEGWHRGVISSIKDAVTA